MIQNLEHARALAFHSLVMINNKIQKVIDQKGESAATKESAHQLQMLVNYFRLLDEKQEIKKPITQHEKPLNKYQNKEEYRKQHAAEVANKNFQNTNNY